MPQLRVPTAAASAGLHGLSRKGGLRMVDSSTAKSREEGQEPALVQHTLPSALNILPPIAFQRLRMHL